MVLLKLNFNTLGIYLNIDLVLLLCSDYQRGPRRFQWMNVENRGVQREYSPCDEWWITHTFAPWKVPEIETTLQCFLPQSIWHFIGPFYVGSQVLPFPKVMTWWMIFCWFDRTTRQISGTRATNIASKTAVRLKWFPSADKTWCSWRNVRNDSKRKPGGKLWGWAVGRAWPSETAQNQILRGHQRTRQRSFSPHFHSSFFRLEVIKIECDKLFHLKRNDILKVSSVKNKCARRTFCQFYLAHRWVTGTGSRVVLWKYLSFLLTWAINK